MRQTAFRCSFWWLLLSAASALSARAQAGAAPLSIGQTFTLASAVLGESRRINVYLPPACADSATRRLPVLYMPDGGLAEDFLHVAGLVQVLTGNGTMRPFILVGIENTARRRDLTGPTTNAGDLKIAPRVGGSAAFRQFIRTELMPVIRQRYRTTAETALVGESLAGLFVVETFLREPDLFDTYLYPTPLALGHGGKKPGSRRPAAWFGQERFGTLRKFTAVLRHQLNGPSMNALPLTALLLGSPILSAGPAPRPAPATQLVTIVVSELASTQAQVKLNFYNAPDKFLKDGQMAIRLFVKPEGKKEITVPVELTPGEWAVALTQDLNNNDKLDKNFLGIPTEPFAFSNNIKPRFAAPSFQECKFTVDGPGQVVTITSWNDF